MEKMAGSDWDTFIQTELLELYVDNQWAYLGFVRYIGLIFLGGTRLNVSFRDQSACTAYSKL